MMISWPRWHQTSCSQTIRMTICFRWWKISWRLWQRQTGLTTIYCLLLSLEHVLNVTRYGASGRERGRGPLINFDCEWNFQFGLRPSGKVEACDSLLSKCLWVSHTKCHFFLSGRGQGGGKCCDELWRDQSGAALNCQLVCVGSDVSRCDCYVSLTPRYRATLLSGTQTSRHRCVWSSLGSDPSCREKVPDRLVTIPKNARCVSCHRCHQLRRSHHFNTRRDSSSASENWINVRVKRDLVLGNKITVSFSAQWSSYKLVVVPISDI